MSSHLKGFTPFFPPFLRVCVCVFAASWEWVAMVFFHFFFYDRWSLSSFLFLSFRKLLPIHWNCFPSPPPLPAHSGHLFQLFIEFLCPLLIEIRSKITWIWFSANGINPLPSSLVLLLPSILMIRPGWWFRFSANLIIHPWLPPTHTHVFFFELLAPLSTLCHLHCCSLSCGNFINLCHFCVFAVGVFFLTTGLSSLLIDLIFFRLLLLLVWRLLCCPLPIACVCVRADRGKLSHICRNQRKKFLFFGYSL